MSKRLSLVTLLLVVIAILVFGSQFVNTMFTKQIVDLDQALQRNKSLKDENEHLTYIHSLSVEFGFDPRIVMVVDELSRRYVVDDVAYRMLNREMMTYLFLGLIWAESNGRPSAVGDNGKALGLTQIWLSTAHQHNEEITENDLLTINGNLEMSFAHSDWLLRKYRGNIALWLYGWNRGAGKVDELIRYGGQIENGYAEKVYMAAELINGRLD